MIFGITLLLFPRLHTPVIATKPNIDFPKSIDNFFPGKTLGPDDDCSQKQVCFLFWKQTSMFDGEYLYYLG